MSKRRYHVEIRWTHRLEGPQTTKVTSQGRSIRMGIHNALDDFFHDQIAHARHTKRRQHLDAHKHIRVEAWRL
jgi:hypothetical protein